MKIKGVIWLEAIVEKLTVKHGVQMEEIETLLENEEEPPKFRYAQRAIIRKMMSIKHLGSSPGNIPNKGSKYRISCADTNGADAGSGRSGDLHAIGASDSSDEPKHRR